MTNEELNSKINNIKETIGEESTAKINDVLMEILTDNNAMNTEIETQKEAYSKKEKEYNDVLKTNSRLVQQVTATVIEKEPKKDDDNKIITYKTEEKFDKKGNFII